ncbi:cytochrome P450 52A13 [Aspergillus heteromorphus CBS 117.55]|uniref:Cytochrome P450 52A13 n=1 Tax=Aspergillus heteromorphus CBS 117.55 TaxID=1448321 RepID=A0A317VAB1_9EURO|nr:cytochrome P450 52A13 [Aspergillus heteromorphus CBS 117.55]PWY71025.1 cytochrome P450 52A13 [Aspergillus heteromorphus CBS 117.55]
MTGFHILPPGLSSVLPIVLAAVGLAWLTFRRISYGIASRRFAAENGCQPVQVRYPQNHLLLGLDFVVDNVRAMRDKRFLELLVQRHTSAGPTFSAQAIARRGIFTVDPANIKTILSVRFKDYSLGERQSILGPLLGRGIFVTDGEEWSHSRALLRPSFVKDQVADLGLVNSHIDDLLHRIHTGETVDLQPLFMDFTLDSATEFLFGHSTNTLGGGTPEDWAFSRAFHTALKEMALQFRFGPLRRLRPIKREAVDAIQVCRSYLDQFVDDAMAFRSNADHKSRLTQSDSRNIFLRDLATSDASNEKIRDELLNILIAGRDTVASLLGSLFHQLARRPEIWNKIRAEVAELEGKKPSYEELRNLKYTKYCINEALRLWPPLPSNARVAACDTVLPHGGGPTGEDPIHVPKGTVVIYTVYVMHRRKDLFGEDADSFRPERWENRKFSWEYLPFNGGPRICLGQQYALTEALMVVTRFAQEFSSIQSRDPMPWTENLTLTVCPSGGAKVALFR